ncbi:uncharacterized protein LOC133985299 [Scomber scombrus]|uniref:uncharacterized protein LOC133985299 n=1 Tax=Scomber scombrus TaxID=13677 RepID=UPI002DDA683B|nr:uncharacterized protein LOC133985299 [Scomber scombrus]
MRTEMNVHACLYTVQFTCGSQGSWTTSHFNSAMNLHCYSSSDPQAENASVLYDDHFDTVNLWQRGDQHTPLPTCSSISPPDSGCLVCVDQIVYAVCRNLTEKVITMEAGVAYVKISKDECPWLLGDATVQSATESPLSTIQSTDSAGTNPGTWEWWQIFIPILLLLLIAAPMVYCIWRKWCKTSELLTMAKVNKSYVQPN